MGKIIAIGGGEIGRPGYPVETTEIDKEIIKLSQKEKPKLTFIPTATEDSQLYIETVKQHFGKTLGCQISTIELTKHKYNIKQLEEIIFSSDIIYVGGGNTQFMLGEWEKSGLDKVLKDAYGKGIVLSGLSAGAICWFTLGSSDSLRFADPNAPLIALSCLGLVKLTVCPHYDTEKDRKSDFKALLDETKTVGLALDECAAIKIINEEFEILSSKEGSSCWICRWSEGQYIKEKLTKGFKGKLDLFFK